MKVKKFVTAIVFAVVGMLGINNMMAGAASAAVLCGNGSPAPNNDLTQCEEWKTQNGKGNIANQKSLMNTLNVIINVVVGAVGFVSVAMIVMGGISFATSQGDTAKTTKARNTILYGVVGLVVAMLAFAIVNFVLSNVFNGS